MPEPDLTDSLRWLGDEVDTEGAAQDLGDKRAQLARAEDIARVFDSRGWGYIAQTLRLQERTDLELIASHELPLRAVPAHRARLQVVRKVLGVEEEITSTITKLRAEIEDLSRTTEEGDPDAA